MELSDSISLSFPKSWGSENEGTKLGPSFSEDSDVSIVETALELDVLEVRKGLEEKSSAGRRGRDGARDDERSKHVLVGTVSDGLEEVGGVSTRERGREETSQYCERRVESNRGRDRSPPLERPTRRHLEAELGEMLVVNEDRGLDPDEGGSCEKGIESSGGLQIDDARVGERKTYDQRREGF